MLKRNLLTLADFLASLKLAIFLLFAMAATLAVGTIIESLHGAKAAQQVIYLSPGFYVLLVLLTVNVAGAALTRLPWKKKHTGFVMTHAGILMILFGSWMTLRFALEGELVLSEGEKSDRMSLAEPLLQISNVQEGRNLYIPIQPTPFQWKGTRPLKVNSSDGLQARLLAYYPHAQGMERVVPEKEGQAAAQIAIFNEKVQSGGWLFEGVQDRDTMALGPATIRFAATPVEDTVSQPSAQEERGDLIVSYQGKEVSVPVGEALGKEYPLPGTSYTLKVARFLPNAIVQGNQLVNQSEEPANPACEVLIQGEGLQEAHTVFARFPDFPTIHGLKPSKTGVTLRYDFPESFSSSDSELVIYHREDKLFYRVKTKESFSQEAFLEPKKEYPTGWMDLRLRLTDYLPNAAYDFYYEPRPMPSQGKSPQPAALIEFQKGSDKKQAWFSSGQHQVVMVDGTPYHVKYGTKVFPLGFDIQLKDFMIDYYPGTTRPAAFKSSVYMEDSSEGISREVLVSMNHPLEHRGFKIYQAGYHQSEGEPDISIFQVARDPGIPVKYAGSIIMVLGIITMYYMKKFAGTNPFPVVSSEEASLSGKTAERGPSPETFSNSRSFHEEINQV